MTIDQVRDFIESSPNLKNLVSEVERRLESDPAHDMSHFFRVASWTSRIGRGALDPRLVIAAAFLHDVVNVPKNSPDRAKASEFSAEVTKELLPTLGFSTAETQEVADAVRCHSFSRGEEPTTILGKALQDADRLESLGSLGIMRTFSTGGTLKTQYFHADDPWGVRRARNDTRYSVDHFFMKLLKLPNTMKTPAGRAEALRRAEFMKVFLSHLGEELAIPLEAHVVQGFFEGAHP